MGCVQSFSSPEDALAKQKEKTSSNIDKQLRKQASKEQSEIKLLLLGAGESGKSTIAKQMKILHQNGYNPNELKSFIPHIFENILSFIVILVKTAQENGIVFEDDALTQQCEQLKQLHAENNVAALETRDEAAEGLWTAMAAVWSNEAIRTFLDEAENAHLNQTSKKFVDDMARISAADYVPTLEDVLLTRVKTTGIVESVFHFNNYNFRMFDVGGQRSERRKWIHCFEMVTGLIFVCSLSEYNQTLVEDDTTNRMQESLKLFGSTCNSQWFKKASIILFLNKKDLFQEKIKKIPLTVCFPEYTGSNNYEETSEYIREKYESLNKDPQKDIYSHFTCATDTEGVKFVFNAVSDTVIKNSLKEYGLY